MSSTPNARKIWTPMKKGPVLNLWSFCKTIMTFQFHCIINSQHILQYGCENYSYHDHCFLLLQSKSTSGFSHIMYAHKIIFVHWLLVSKLWKYQQIEKLGPMFVHTKKSLPVSYGLKKKKTSFTIIKQINFQYLGWEKITLLIMKIAK